MATYGGISYDEVFDWDLLKISRIRDTVEKINEEIENRASK